MAVTIKHFKVKEMKEVETSLSLPLEINIDELTPGWEENPKVLVQALWERGVSNIGKL